MGQRSLGRDELARAFGDPGWQIDFADEVARAVVAQAGDDAEDLGLFKALRASNADSVRVFSLVLAGQADLGVVPLAPLAASYARAMARRGLNVSTFLRLGHLEHAAAWRAILRRFHEQFDGGPTSAATVEALADAFVRFDSEFTQALRHEFEREQERLRVGRSDVSRSIERLLDGADTDASWLVRRFRFDIDLPHLALVAWREDDAGDDGSLRTAIEELLAELGIRSRMSVELPGGLVAAWARPDGPPERWTVPEPLARRCGVSVGLGTPGTGLAGFRRSHREAIEARRVARLAGVPGGRVTRYLDVGVVALATTREVAAQAFMREQLGALLEGEARRAVLRTTLLEFLEQRGRSSSVARSLGVHVNTVINRVRAAEALLPADRPARDSDLVLALRLAEHVH
ncbi:PucR family transcriptional regulator [Patulibacter defluvii]|uniref:PucR family transcriptional regulator n=1 Tax=Patulibacter defluvii TaxID=3095358 RepID=UPI002A74BC38|nr:helix-turn-helix domain-containing protein [Patulibacter sp. DM4]